MELLSLLIIKEFLISILNQLIKRIGRIQKFSHHYNPEDHSAMMDNIKLFLDKDDSLNLHIRPYEPMEIDWIIKHVKSGDFVLDIGANIGYHTLILSKIVGKTGRVYSFEPEPNNFKLLKKNLTINNCDNVILVNSAVGNEDGKLKLFLSNPKFKGANGMHRTYPSKYSSGETTDVDVVSLDNYLDSTVKKKLSFIKIDAEGSELPIIQGMQTILPNSKLFMLLEFVPSCIREKGDDPYEIISILQKNDFNFKKQTSRYRIKPIKNIFNEVKDLDDYNISNNSIHVENLFIEKNSGDK